MVVRLSGAGIPARVTKPAYLPTAMPVQIQINESTTSTVYDPQSVMLTGMPLYVGIAENLTRQMARGALRPGDRVPSLRQLSQQERVSISTALQAYLWLESRGYLESRPQSGFYVRTPFAKLIPEPQCEKWKCAPAAAGTDAVLAELVASFGDPAIIQFGASGASPELFPCRRLNLIVRQIIKQDPDH